MGNHAMNLSARELNRTETQGAKHFLYDVYVRQLGWHPPADNPSQWRVYHDDSGPYFDDIFNQSAVWYGVFDGETTAAVGRLVTPLNGRLEIEHYTVVPPEYRTGTCCEMNRLAVDSHYNDTPAVSLLCASLLRHALDSAFDRILVGAPSASVSLLQKIGFSVIHQFGYSADDPSGAHLTCFDLSDRAKAASIMETAASDSASLRFF